MFKEFNNLYGLTAKPLTGLKAKPLTHQQARKTVNLILDEVAEFAAEFYPECRIDFYTGDVQTKTPNYANAFKELTDIRYITGQQTTELGGDVPTLDAEVHRSNMSKAIKAEHISGELMFAKERYPDARVHQIDTDLFVLKCAATGKVIKPQGYSPAEITPKMYNN